ncbi:unnamed protein product, partial [Larinioides sclopetarius]
TPIWRKGNRQILKFNWFRSIIGLPYFKYNSGPQPILVQKQATSLKRVKKALLPRECQKTVKV